MSESQDKKPAPSLADAVMRAKAAKAVKKAKAKKDRPAASKHAPKHIAPHLSNVSTKGNVPRMTGRAKKV
jgi:hypothetical protein